MLNIDKTLHAAYDALKDFHYNDFHEVGVVEHYYDYYYCEDELYIIHDRLTDEILFVEARSPKEALDKYKNITQEASLNILTGSEVEE